MQHINVHRREIGVYLNDGNASVTVWAPFADSVSIQTATENIVLSKHQYGYWRTMTHLLRDGDRYSILLDGKPFPDPASLSQPDGVHGASQATDLDTFTWTDDHWQNIPLNEYIIYELHAGTFSADGNFNGILEKLDYLVELGITAIEIMPVAQFPGSRNWGYDGVFPFAVQHSYGGAKALQQLVNACHEKGLAVILDVVYNHTGPEGNYWREFAPYFTDKYHTPWGSPVNFDDAWCDGVRHFFIENVLMWLRDFHIDALRMDAVHAIYDFSAKHILREMKDYTDLLMAQNGRKYHLIIECDLNDHKYIRAANEHGYGMDAQWCDEFHHSLRVASGNERKGYYADFNGIEDLAKSYKHAYVYDGIYSPHRLRNFGSKTDDHDSRQFVVFSQNHDQTGNRMLGERSSTLVSFDMLKLLAGAVLVSPFLPLLFMGEEYGEINPFQYFVSHTDESLVAAVRKGRKEEFAAFQEDGAVPDPQSADTFEQSKLQWNLLAEDKHQMLFRYYKTLIGLRKSHPLLNCRDRKLLETKAYPQQQVLVLYSWNETSQMVCLMNFSKEPQTVPLPIVSGSWVKIFDSAAAEWQQIKPANQQSTGPSNIISSESLLIYEHNDVQPR